MLLAERVNSAVLAFPATVCFLEFVGSLDRFHSSFAIGTDTYTRRRRRIMDSVVQIADLCLEIQEIVTAFQASICFLERYKFNPVVVLEKVVPHLRSILFSWNGYGGLLTRGDNEHPKQQRRKSEFAEHQCLERFVSGSLTGLMRKQWLRCRLRCERPDFNMPATALILSWALAHFPEAD